VPTRHSGARKRTDAWEGNDLTDHKVVVIVSDLHMSDGSKRDDFISAGGQFPALLKRLSSTPEGQAGAIELLVNGDFLDFVQAAPDVYKLDSAKYWCSEEESLRKLEIILAAHADVFDALRVFADGRNGVTLVPGNHDIDVFWPRVQARLRQVVGAINIEPPATWYRRFEGKLCVGHGNHIDPANTLDQWEQPLILGEYGVMRMKMCPGTLFVVKFVSWLEKSYPFANNLHPETKLAGLLAKGDRFGLVAAAWMLTRFGLRHPTDALSSDGTPKTGEHLLSAIRNDLDFAKRCLDLYRGVRRQPNATVESMRLDLVDEDRVSAFMLECLAETDAESWLGLFDQAEPSTLDATGPSKETLAIQQSSALEKSDWSKEAAIQWEAGADVVVMGHTHLPDHAESGSRRYFNPGSWIRYVDSEDLKGLTLNDLNREEAFPYQLNYVWVERAADGSVHGSMTCFEEQNPKFHGTTEPKKCLPPRE
jgi:UDP-2,3-diacylglucosamine pyrophosphatase LpxH